MKGASFSRTLGGLPSAAGGFFQSVLEQGCTAGSVRWAIKVLRASDRHDCSHRSPRTTCVRDSAPTVSVSCRVPGCGRLSKTALGEQRQVTVTHSNAIPYESTQPLVRTFGIECEDGASPGAAAASTTGADAAPPVDSDPGLCEVRVVQLKVQISMALSRVLTGHPPTPL